jgi:hypothetical protein
MTLRIERFQPEGMNVRMSGGQPSYSHVVTVSCTGKIVYIAGQLARDIATPTDTPRLAQISARLARPGSLFAIKS